MKNVIIILALILLGCVPPKPSSQSVYIIIGQSNAAGRALNSNALPEEIDSINTSKIYTGATWDRLWIANNVNNNDELNKHGPELGISLERENVFIIKTAEGGTSIDYWRTGAGWDLYRSHLNSRLLLTNPVIEGILFAQGEKDATFEGNAELWNPRMRAWIDWHRDSINSDIPIVIFKITSTPYDYLINAYIDTIASDYDNVTAVETSGYPLIDANHFTYAGMKTMANDFLNAADALGSVPFIMN